MMNNWDWNGWGAVFMVVSMVVFWGAIIGVIWLVVRPRGAQRSEGREADAIERLRRRFADGEISNEEYQERLRILDETRR